MRAAIRNAVAILMIAFLFQSSVYAADQPDTIIINLTNTYIENVDQDIKKPIKLIFDEPHKEETIINLPADFTQPEDEEVKKIGEITASYSRGTFKIDGEEFSEMPDRIGSGYIKSNTDNTDQSEADFQKMGDNFNIFIIVIWALSLISLTVLGIKKFKNKSKRGTKLWKY